MHIQRNLFVHTLRFLASLLNMPPKPQLEFNWCAPVSGDGFYLGLPTWERPPEFEYIVQIFSTAEKFGFKQLLIGMGFTSTLR